jgi:hypothetical protein
MPSAGSAGRRALSVWQQAILVLRWFCDAPRVDQLAADNRISLSTAYRYVHEGIDVLAAVAPGLHGVPGRPGGRPLARAPGRTLVRTDRSKAVGPTVRDGRPVDLWWPGKHHHHGGNVQVVTAPDGWPLWTSGVRAGREHDITCARALWGSRSRAELVTCSDRPCPAYGHDRLTCRFACST